MIIHGQYLGDKADVWSTGCILLELVAGHEKFCDVWMTAYDYEILQDKDKFTTTIRDTLEQLPEVLNFSAHLNDFILRFLELSASKRPSTAALCSHPWLEGLIEDELASRSHKLTMHDARPSALSPSQSFKNLNSSTPTNGGGIADDADAAEERHRVVEMIFSNLSERERKHMQEYIMHHKNDGPDQHHAQMHLPPIVPSTPSIGNAKKILRKGNELANQNFHLGMQSPQSFKNVYSPADAAAAQAGAGAGALSMNSIGSSNGGGGAPYSPFSPTPSGRGGGLSSRTNSISPLPGLSENHVQEFDSSRDFAIDRSYQTPQHTSQAKGSGGGAQSSARASLPGPSGGARLTAEPKHLLFASQSDKDLQDNTPLSLSSSSH